MQDQDLVTQDDESRWARGLGAWDALVRDPDLVTRASHYAQDVLKLGYSLNATIEPLDLDSNRVYRVTDEEEPLPSEESVPSESPSFHICLDDRLHADTISQLALDKETIFVCLDTAMDDSMKVNLAMQCLLKVI